MPRNVSGLLAMVMINNRRTTTGRVVDFTGDDFLFKEIIHVTADCYTGQIGICR